MRVRQSQIGLVLTSASNDFDERGTKMASSDFIVPTLAIRSNLNASELQPVTVVEHVDLDRYCGIWHEIARLPNSFQRKCDCCTTAEYSRLSDGTIKVVNRCRKVDGTIAVAEGIARKEETKGSNAKLKVRFAPSWLSWIPFVWGTYWVIDLAPDYTYAVIGVPSRKYLWILSRSPIMSPTTLSVILNKVKKTGYDTNRLIFSRHE